jgi:hypothetical protein
MDPMVGPYLYISIVLIVLGFLAVKMYLRSGSPIESHRPALPITEADVETAVRAKRIVEAIQWYGLLHRCDLTEATQAVQAMAAALKAADAANVDAIDPDATHPEEMPQDHRET